MFLIFDFNNNYVMASSVVLSSHPETNFIYKFYETFDPQYKYSLLDGEVVKGEMIQVDLVEEARKNIEWADKKYQRQRAPEYPSIGDQLVALFKAGVFPAEMAAAIQAVKDKYPKEQA